MSGLNSENLRVPKTIKLFIGGEFPRTESGRTLPVYVHGTEEIYAHVCRGSRKDFRNAVTAAQGAASGWESRSPYNRAQILYRMAEMAEGRKLEFLEILRETNGMENSVAEKEFNAMIDAFVYYAGFADKYQQVMGCVNPVSGPHHSFSTAEPVGLVGLISGEDTSLSEFTREMAAILASGSVVVALLPASGSAWLASLAEVLATSDLPKGVVNLLSGQVEELYKHFGTHMELQSLTYLGRDQNRRGELREMATANMKRVVEAPKGKTSGLSLERLASFVEVKTVWHPIGY